jgi:hypothetical protein
MRWMVIILISWAYFSIGCIGVRADDGAAKQKDIRELFKLQDSEKLNKSIIEQLVKAASQRGSEQQQAKVLKAIQEELKYSELAELLVPIYDKNFTHDEIKELMGFYKSSVGKKFVSKQQLIMNESSFAIQEWAAAGFKRVQARLKSNDRHVSSVSSSNK